MREFSPDMLSTSLKSRFMQEFSRFSRILAGLVGQKCHNLKIKNVPKIKNLKKVFFLNNRKRKKRFLHLCCKGTSSAAIYVLSFKFRHNVLVRGLLCNFGTRPTNC